MGLAPLAASTTGWCTSRAQGWRQPAGQRYPPAAGAAVVWNLPSCARQNYCCRRRGDCRAAGGNGWLQRPIARGMTMVMADNQDISSLEQLKSVNGKAALPVSRPVAADARTAKPSASRAANGVTETIYATGHGPLLNRALRNPPKTELNSPQLQRLRHRATTATFEPDRSGDESATVDGTQRGRGAAAYPSDPPNSAEHGGGRPRQHRWQVTGRYPRRKHGLGLLPSPGWSGEYDWDGYLDPGQHPFVLNPDAGYFSTANNRKAAGRTSHAFSTLHWYFPSAASAPTSCWRRVATTAPRLRRRCSWTAIRCWRTNLSQPEPAGNAARACRQRSTSCRQPGSYRGALNAGDAAPVRRQPDTATIGCGSGLGRLSPALRWRPLPTNSARPTASRCGGFLTSNDTSYGRNRRPPARPRRQPVLGQYPYAAAGNLRRHHCAGTGRHAGAARTETGKDRQQWVTGQAAPLPLAHRRQQDGTPLGAMDRFCARRAGRISWQSRPFPAGGDHTTLNVAAYRIGEDFDTWLVPAMRVIVDFSRAEPMLAINSSGQSSDPTSEIRRRQPMVAGGRYQPFALQAENLA